MASNPSSPIALSMELIRRDMAEVIGEIRYHKQEYILLRHGRAVAKLIPLSDQEIAKFSIGTKRVYKRKYDRQKAVNQ